MLLQVIFMSEETGIVQYGRLTRICRNFVKNITIPISISTKWSGMLIKVCQFRSVAKKMEKFSVYSTKVFSHFLFFIYTACQLESRLYIARSVPRSASPLVRATLLFQYPVPSFAALSQFTTSAFRVLSVSFVIQ